MRFLFTMSDIGRPETRRERIALLGRSRPFFAPGAEKSAGETDISHRKDRFKPVQSGITPAGEPAPGLSLQAHRPFAYRPPVPPFVRMVEPDGIEPTTSCLQSTRSPN
jgi:hypothetical protein